MSQHHVSTFGNQLVAVLVATSGLQTSSSHQQFNLFTEYTTLGVDIFYDQLSGLDGRNTIRGKVSTVRPGKRPF